MSMKIVPKTITGILHNHNKGAVDWGWQGLVSYGCQNTVTVADPKTVQVLQTLDKHRGYITKVKWASENYHHDLASSYQLRLASADFNGKIIVWDVSQATILAEFADGSKPITELQWVSQQDNSQDLLVALHPPYNLVVWNAATGTRVWKKSYTDVLRSFSFDPFDGAKLAFLGLDCIIFVEDFSVTKIPSDNGRKYYISTPTNHGNMSHSSSAEKLASQKAPSKQTLTRRMTNILVGDTVKRGGESVDDSSLLNECLQLLHHAACRHHLILLYPRELLILDLEVNQTVCVIATERNASPYSQVVSLQQRDMLLCLHENGSVSVRLRRKQPAPCLSSSPQQSAENCLTNMPNIDVTYDLRCQSDPLRVTKNSRVYGIMSCPVSENKVALIMSDSRLLLWELKSLDHQNCNGSNMLSPLYMPEHSDKPLPTLTTMPQAPPPVMSLSDMISHSHTQHSTTPVQLKFLLTGLLSGVAPPPFVIRMCPPLTTKNWAVYQPLLALGTFSGLIQVYNLASGQLHRELSVHTCTVRGIEWVSLQSFLSFAHPSAGQTGLVKNEVFLTDIQTGKSTAFRLNKEEESAIDGLRVSYLKQYFVIMFKDKPFELWDLHNGTLLRQMPKNFPQVTALEWSPSHNLKTLKKKLSGQENVGSLSDVSTSLSLTASSNADPTSRNEAGKGGAAVREHFVFTDSDGLMYHFIVEGNMIKDGSKIPPDGGMGSITRIAWKAETLVLADVDGNLNLWDLKARLSRAVPTGRGWIRKLKFAPGRGNMKLLVLYNDGAEVWDAKDVQRVSSVKSPKDISKLTDVDWAASDRPVLACTDGTVRVFDMEFTTGSSPLETNLLSEPLFCPHLLPPKAALTLKSLLQHQHWNEQYQLHLEETDLNADISKIVNEQLDLLDEDVKSYMGACHYGVAQRSLITARLFGDESEVLFWTVALHYLRVEKTEPASMKMSRSGVTTSSGDLFIPSTPSRESDDLVVFDSECSAGDSWQHVKDAPLGTNYDILSDSSTFLRSELERVFVHDNKRATYEHARKCAETLVLLGETDRAVQVLLETDADNDTYYTDSLRACLVASIRSSGASQSTIKLVATNLIASGKLMEGVQLLCLIDKGLDACRYLQTYGHWSRAAWLAKATLSHGECCEVMRRYADHLASPQVNDKGRAVLLLLSIGQFVRVIELLYSMRFFDRAALFIEACQEFSLLPQDASTMTEAVFLEYARQLLQLGNRRAFEHYCHCAGDKGKLLAKEIDSVYSDNH